MTQGSPAISNAVKQEIVEPFVKGTMVTLKTMAGLEVQLESIKVSGKDKLTGDVSGVMGLSGKRGEGFVAITFHESLAKQIVSHLLGLDVSELQEADIWDGVGEIINMIAGDAKRAFLGTPYQFDIALPNIITGSGHEIGYRTETTCYVAAFTLDDNRFHLLVALSRRE